MEKANVFRQFQSLRLVPCSTITAKQNNVLGILCGQFFQKNTHTSRIAIRHDKKVSLTGQWLHGSVDIAILPDMVAGHCGADTSLAPAVFRLVDSPKSSFILKHQANCLPPVYNFQLFYGVVNFFEAAISSSLAFWGCLLRGITLRHLWRRSTKYICPLLTGWLTAL